MRNERNCLAEVECLAFDANVSDDELDDVLIPWSAGSPGFKDLAASHDIPI